MHPTFIICMLIPLAIGGLSAWLTMGSMALYGSLTLPPLAPPSWVFPAVWTVLFLLMGAASWLVWQADAPLEERKRAMGLYGVQLAVNFVWPLLFFRAERYLLAFFWLILLLWLVAVTARAFAKICSRAAWMLAPYLAWLLFAGYLNLFVWLLNR